MEKEEIISLLEGIDVPMRRIERVLGMPTGVLSKAKGGRAVLPGKWGPVLRGYVAKVRGGVEVVGVVKGKKKRKWSRKGKVVVPSGIPELGVMKGIDHYIGVRTVLGPDKEDGKTVFLDCKWGDKQGDQDKVDDIAAIQDALDSVNGVDDYEKEHGVHEGDPVPDPWRANIEFTEPGPEAYVGKRLNVGDLDEVEDGHVFYGDPSVIKEYDSPPLPTDFKPLQFADFDLKEILDEAGKMHDTSAFNISIPPVIIQDAQLGKRFREVCAYLGKDPEVVLVELEESLGKEVFFTNGSLVASRKPDNTPEYPQGLKDMVEPLPGTNAYFLRYGRWVCED